MYNNKRGQAALEFLMTYGWAILSAIIVIGALGSYFYFNQEGSTSIFVSAPFYGVAASATGTTLSLEIDNRGGETLSSVEVAVSTCTTNTTGFVGATTGPQIVTLAGCTMTSGESFKGDITVSYLRPGSALPLMATGSVSTPVA
ncbi:MAG: hypothetical protein V1888_02140 [archaeon]